MKELFGETKQLRASDRAALEKLAAKRSGAQDVNQR